MAEKAVYVLSGDPITNGHIDIVKRARQMFGSLRVALAVHPDKKYTYTLKERETLARKALQGLDVTVDSFPGLTVDYAKLNGIPTIIRSARSSSDFDFEKLLNDIGMSQSSEVETILFFARQHLAHVSSSAVKELQRLHGLIHEYVPFVVKQSLEKTISHQVLIGLTGEIGAGKSFVAQSILIGKFDSSKAFLVNEIDMDRLGHEILETNPAPMFINVRKKLIDLFGQSIAKSPTSNLYEIDTKILGSLIFDETIIGHSQALGMFNEITRDAMLTLFREKLTGLKGIIFVSSALFAEADIGHLTNYNVILVHADKEIRKERLRKRGYTEREIDSRMGAQLDYEHKKNILEEKIIENNYGNLITFDNSNSTEKDISQFFSYQYLTKEFES
jgi:pantetheine-phosphate adenylyltransferase